MYFASWPDRPSLLLGTVDEATAKRIAIEVAGREPARLVAFEEGAFVAEVFFDDDEVLVTQPLDHVDELLETLHELDEGDVESEEEEEEEEEEKACGSTALTDDEQEAQCERAEGHHGPHRALVDGTIFEWEQDE